MLRIASYNIRVDHTDDIGTINEWMNRRTHAAKTVIGLRADLVLVQEPYVFFVPNSHSLYTQ